MFLFAIATQFVNVLFFDRFYLLFIKLIRMRRECVAHSGTCRTHKHTKFDTTNPGALHFVCCVLCSNIYFDAKRKIMIRWHRVNCFGFDLLLAICSLTVEWMEGNWTIERNQFNCRLHQKRGGERGEEELIVLVGIVWWFGCNWNFQMARCVCRNLEFVCASSVIEEIVVAHVKMEVDLCRFVIP